MADAVSEGVMSRDQLFLSQLGVIEQIITWVCRRRCLRRADAEDFGSVVKSRLIENDCEILAKFEGRSSLKTYLAAVINRLYLDFQVQRFGKWRPSAEARRLGPLGVRLECLLYRDGLTFDESCGVLQTDPRASVTRDALYDMSLSLPHRNRRGTGLEERETPRSDRPSSDIERAERQTLAERTFAAIRSSLARLPARDRLFLRLHLEAGMGVAEVSRSLGLEQKALYRRKEDVLRTLRADLEAEGIGPHDARELLSTLDWDAAFTAEVEPGVWPGEEAGPRPSQETGSVGRREAMR